MIMTHSLDKRLSIRYPIIQAPMLGVTTPAMVAAVSNSGGLGSLPLGGLPPEKARLLIQQTKEKTNQPFAVNLFAHSIADRPDAVDVKAMEDVLEPIYQSYGLPSPRKPITDYQFFNHTHLLDVLLEEQIAIVSFTFGLLEPEMVDRLKQRNVTLMGTATSVKEGALLEQSGVDVIVAQGVEAGGHRGTFLENEPLPQIGLMALLPQLVDQVSLPVVAAGGLFDHRSVNAVFALGAQGAQLGTYFIAAHESAASQGYKDALLHAQDTATQLTKAFTGRWARGIRNRFMEQMEQSVLAFPPYTYQNSMTAALRDYGRSNNIADVISLWAGQSAGTSRQASTHQLFTDLIRQIQENAYPVF